MQSREEGGADEKIEKDVLWSLNSWLVITGRQRSLATTRYDNESFLHPGVTPKACGKVGGGGKVL